MQVRQLICAALLCAGLGPVQAELSAEELSRLDQSLTPLGAEAAGNAAGTIPAWEGGLKTPPINGFKPGGHYPDPYADDKPLFTITQANAEQYQDHLSEGQRALLRKFPSYKLIVYPTRRSAAFPQAMYNETRTTAAKAKLADSGNGVLHATGGIPFPIPKNGQEAIWNHLLRYRGDTYATTWTSAAVLPNGTYAPTRVSFELDFGYGNLEKPVSERTPNRLLNFLEVFHSPPRMAGTVLLVFDAIDQVKAQRTSWLYLPGQRRVRLAPEVSYDGQNPSSDGLVFGDDFDMYNGAIDRYDWKLLGKKEMFVPYNAYRLSAPTLKHADVLGKQHLNQDHARYELHRVWVVQATLKPGVRHQYAKRVFYIDEDSWTVVLTDRFDGRGQLWRVGEAHSMVLYDLPLLFMTADTHYDLQANRYYVKGLYNEEPKILEPIKRTAADFTPARLRDIGTR